MLHFTMASVLTSPARAIVRIWRDSEVIGGVTGWREPNGESIASRWACSLCVTPLYIAIASPNHNPIMLNQLSDTARAPRAKFGTRRHDLSNSGTVLERKVVTPTRPADPWPAGGWQAATPHPGTPR